MQKAFQRIQFGVSAPEIPKKQKWKIKEVDIKQSVKVMVIF